LRSGDGDRAERVMRAHVMANAQAIASCLPRQGQQPKIRPQRPSRTMKQNQHGRSRKNASKPAPARAGHRHAQ
jgi:hypothetical protein